ncbi:MAG: hypothetical protein ACR2JC_07710 [Chloroflexota bacterium]|nr:MAG: hypothetical protein DLM70_11875 [Chloroflexota bacterium]
MALALSYLAEINSGRASPLDTASFLTSLDYCRLHLAVQFLGWSPEWTPPSAHAQNWLEQAERLVDELGV